MKLQPRQEKQFHCGYASCSVLLHNRNRKIPFYAQCGDVPNANTCFLEPDYSGSVLGGEFHVTHIYAQTIQIHWQRSEEHTSELQSRENLVCRLLLEKKKNDIE